MIGIDGGYQAIRAGFANQDGDDGGGVENHWLAREAVLVVAEDLVRRAWVEHGEVREPFLSDVPVATARARASRSVAGPLMLIAMVRLTGRTAARSARSGSDVRRMSNGSCQSACIDYRVD